MTEINLDDFGRQEPQLALFPERRWRWGRLALFLDAPRESSPLSTDKNCPIRFGDENSPQSYLLIKCMHGVYVSTVYCT